MMVFPELADVKTAYQWLEHWADETPDSQAIVSPSLSLSFSNLRTAAEALALNLVDQGVIRGKKVGFCLPPEIDSIATLAVMRIGAISASISAADLGALDPKALDFVLFSKDTAQSLKLEAKSIVIGTEHMIADPDVVAVSGAFQFRATDPVRLFPLDGDSEYLDFVSFSHQTVTKRVETLFEIEPLARFQLGLFEPLSHQGFLNSMHCLAKGVPLMTHSAPYHLPDAMKFMQSNPPEVLVGSAYEVGRVVVALIEQNISLPKLKAIRLLNSTISEKFFDLVKFKLGVEVLTEYGSFETGPALFNTIRAKAELTDLGQLTQGARAKILNSDGFPLVPGQFGQLSIRTLGALSVSNPSKALRQLGTDGHFLMDDLASWNNQRFWLGPNATDQLVVGGELIDGDEIESFALDQPNIREAACFAAHGKHGEPALSIVVVPKESMDLNEFADSVAREFPIHYPSIYLERGGIPTYKNGKPHAEFLAQLVS